MKNIKYIAFDADDTLWLNEPHFYKTELEYCKLLSEFEADAKIIHDKLFTTEMNNLSLFGFGVKSFTLSLIENAISISDNKISPELIAKIIELGKELIQIEIEPMEGVENVLSYLSQNYCLIVATKGDLLDQERKLKKSGLVQYFDHIEIMSDKQIDDYKSLLSRHKIHPADFLMVGNSLKSDILPVVELGANAIHVPSQITWQHEKIGAQEINRNDILTVENIQQVLNYVN